MRDAGRNGTSAHTNGATQDYDDAFDGLRVALLDVIDGRVSCAELRTPVRRLCIFAHSQDMKAEQLLVRFKEVWSSLPPLRDQPRGRQRNDLMATVATMCIEEFYGPSDGNGAPPER